MMTLSSGIPRMGMCGYHMAKYFSGCLQFRRQLWTNSSRRILQLLRLQHDDNDRVMARRHSSLPTRSCSVHKLSSRGMFKVEGKDASDFLQGLITNTMKWVEPSRSAMYSMMLNVQGRVMYDLIVYNISDSCEEPCFLLECDSSATDSLIKDIRKYKLRKKVALTNVTDQYSLSAVVAPDPPIVQELSVPDSDCVIFTPDPRVKEFGWRLVTTADNNNTGKDSVRRLGVSAPEEEYHIHRYSWGISEGCTDLPPGNCFPLESNLVYLHGECFQKGCYVGQELTARTYHTGVTRKRLMPLLFDKPPENLSPGADIRTEDDKSAGKYRHSVGRYGIGLMRLAESHKKLVIKTEDDTVYHLTASKPAWWPSDTQGKQPMV